MLGSVLAGLVLLRGVVVRGARRLVAPLLACLVATAGCASEQRRTLAAPRLASRAQVHFDLTTALAGAADGNEGDGAADEGKRGNRGDEETSPGAITAIVVGVAVVLGVGIALGVLGAQGKLKGGDDELPEASLGRIDF